VLQNSTLVVILGAWKLYVEAPSSVVLLSGARSFFFKSLVFLLGVGSSRCSCWVLEVLLFWFLVFSLGVGSPVILVFGPFVGCSLWVLEVLFLFCNYLFFLEFVHFFTLQMSN
jgi:hypothetical protein